MEAWKLAGGIRLKQRERCPRYLAQDTLCTKTSLATKTPASTLPVARQREGCYSHLTDCRHARKRYRCPGSLPCHSAYTGPLARACLRAVTTATSHWRNSGGDRSWTVHSGQAARVHTVAATRSRHRTQEGGAGFALLAWPAVAHVSLRRRGQSPVPET